MHALAEGAAIEVSAPQSHFEVHYGRPEYLLVAGGIGITPMVGMAAALLRHGRPFRLLYAGRSQRRDAVRRGARRAARRRGWSCSAPADGERLDLAAEIARLHPEGDLYVCGPLRLMDAAPRGVGGAAAPGRRGCASRPSAPPGGCRPSRSPCACTSSAARSACPPTGRCSPRCAAAGVEMMWDCLRGECGLCVVDVLEAEGRLDHRDVFLSEDEQAHGTKLCACVSRAAGGAVTVDTGFRPDP